MPHAPPTLCPKPGCHGKRRNGVCDVCGPVRRQDNRKHAAARGYDYKWQQFRERYLTQNPLCRDCEQEGIVTAATDVHHIQKLRDRPDLKYEPSNLKPLCETCHKRRTAKGE